MLLFLSLFFFFWILIHSIHRNWEFRDWKESNFHRNSIKCSIVYIWNTRWRYIMILILLIVINNYFARNKKRRPPGWSCSLNGVRFATDSRWLNFQASTMRLTIINIELYLELVIFLYIYCLAIVTLININSELHKKALFK